MVVVLTAVTPEPDTHRSVARIVERWGDELLVVCPYDVESAVDRGDVALVVVVGGPLLDEALSVVARVRQHGPTYLAVLLESTRMQDELISYRLGCDAFVVTPCPELLLEARLRALLVRARPAGAPVSFGCLTLDPLQRSVLVHGEEIHLTRREFDLLQVLLENPRRVVPRAELLEQVWDGRQASDHAIEVHLSRLRAKVADAGGPQIGEAVPRVGYRLGRGRQQVRERSLIEMTS